MPRPGLTTERLIALFLLATVLFTPPFLGIFNSAKLVLGIPALYLYLFAAWVALIAVVALVVERAGDAAGPADEHDGEPAAPAQPQAE